MHTLEHYMNHMCLHMYNKHKAYTHIIYITSHCALYNTILIYIKHAYVYHIAQTHTCVYVYTAYQ